jgi:hypothetical protein
MVCDELDICLGSIAQCFESFRRIVYALFFCMIGEISIAKPSEGTLDSSPGGFNVIKPDYALS